MTKSEKAQITEIANQLTALAEEVAKLKSRIFGASNHLSQNDLENSVMRIGDTAISENYRKRELEKQLRLDND